MNTVIDLGTELLVDRSMLRDPFLRLIVDTIGTPVLKGSAWIAVSKLYVVRADAQYKLRQNAIKAVFQ